MITFHSVTKKFGEDSTALDTVSFHVEPGELLVITGSSGSGKTTLLKLLTKEYTPTEGSIIFDGQPLEDISRSQIYKHRRKLGVVFQDYKLLPDLNVWENIALALSIINKPQEEIESRVTDLLNLIGLPDKAFLFPSQLSGGEAQRVSIARALSTAPQVIFADEPTGNLDEDTSRTITHLLQKINELGTTVFITTHDPAVMDVLKKHRFIQLEKGKLLKDSHPKQFTTHHDDTASKSETDTKTRAKSKHETKPDKASDSKKRSSQASQEDRPLTENHEQTAKSKEKASGGWWPFSSKNKSSQKSQVEIDDKHATVEVEDL